MAIGKGQRHRRGGGSVKNVLQRRDIVNFSKYPKPSPSTMSDRHKRSARRPQQTAPAHTVHLVADKDSQIDLIRTRAGCGTS